MSEVVMGLRDLKKAVKGYKPLYKPSVVRRELKYAWQRAWRGYDDSEIWDIGLKFFQRMPVLLREYKKKNKYPIFAAPKYEREKWGEGKGVLTYEETQKVLDNMIYYFEYSDEETMYKKLYGTSYEDDFKKALQEDKEWYCENKWNIAVREAEKCQQKALRMFTKWHKELWY